MARPKGSKTKKPDAAKPGPRWKSEAERERVKYLVQQYDIKGYTHEEISRMPDVNCSRPMVGNLLREIQKDYQDAYIDNRRMWTMRELAVLMGLRRDACEEIARLRKEGKNKRVSRSGSTDKGSYSEDSDTTEDAELLGWHRLILDTVRETGELLGLKELPAQVFNMQVNNTQVNVVDFDRLLLAALGEPPPQESPSKGSPAIVGGGESSPVPGHNPEL